MYFWEEGDEPSKREEGKEEKCGEEEDKNEAQLLSSIQKMTAIEIKAALKAKEISFRSRDNKDALVLLLWNVNKSAISAIKVDNGEDKQQQEDKKGFDIRGEVGGGTNSGVLAPLAVTRKKEAEEKVAVKLSGQKRKVEETAEAKEIDDDNDDDNGEGGDDDDDDDSEDEDSEDEEKREEAVEVVEEEEEEEEGGGGGGGDETWFFQARDHDDNCADDDNDEDDDDDEDKNTKQCFLCDQYKTARHYSLTQWRGKRDVHKCADCIVAAQERELIAADRGRKLKGEPRVPKPSETKECLMCLLCKTEEEFTARQWLRTSGFGKCSACSNGGASALSRPSRRSSAAAREAGGDRGQVLNDADLEKKVNGYKLAMRAIGRKRLANDLRGSSRVEYEAQLSKEEAEQKATLKQLENLHGKEQIGQLLLATKVKRGCGAESEGLGIPLRNNNNKKKKKTGGGGDKTNKSKKRTKEDKYAEKHGRPMPKKQKSKLKTEAEAGAKA